VTLTLAVISEFRIEAKSSEVKAELRSEVKSSEVKAEFRSESRVRREVEENTESV
jgi:hypothetical protein